MVYNLSIRFTFYIKRKNIGGYSEMNIQTENETIKNLLQKNKIMNKALVLTFLENKDNFNLFEKAIANPTQENRDLVEKAFQEHYEKVRFDFYFTNLIKRAAVDFDKKIRKINERFSLTLDTPTTKGGESGGSIVDLLVDDNPYNPFEQGSTLNGEITNELLFQALEYLTDSQYKILELLYVKNLTNLKAAKTANVSAQYVSQTQKRALQKLKTKMNYSVGE